MSEASDTARSLDDHAMSIRGELNNVFRLMSEALADETGAAIGEIKKGLRQSIRDEVADQLAAFRRELDLKLENTLLKVEQNVSSRGKHAGR